MDLLYGHDRKFGYDLDDSDMVDFLDTNDIFNTSITGFPTPEDDNYENDWLNSILDDPVLNDKMMTDAMNPPCIKSEHSYSINDANSLDDLATEDDIDLLTCSSSNVSSALDLSVTKSVSTSPAIRALKFESTATNTATNNATSSTNTASNTSTTPSSNDHTPFINQIHLSPHTSHSQIRTTTHTHHHNQQQRLHTPPPSTLSISTSTTSGRHQPTIIVTTTSAGGATVSNGGYSLCGGAAAGTPDGGSSTGVLGYPTIHIKQESVDSMDDAMDHKVNLEQMMMPLTPPGSSGSDSDGNISPNHSAPNSPSARHGTQATYASRHAATSSSSPGSPLDGTAFSTPLFVSPISQSGVLILSEEEKRTLISEGYTIPSKLPLTKQEEKNLKKIRRKIKNKISAQESRRKKKEYLEALEKRVEAYNHENCDLKKKVESLENNNRSLLGQLQKLQSLVSKVNKANATQTGTALMVLVFCFAVFLGSFSPSNLNIGYPVKPAQLPFVQPATVGASGPARGGQREAGVHHHHPHYHNIFYNSYMDHRPQPEEDMGPKIASAHDTSSPYDTPNLKSRMLMSVEQEESCDDYRPIIWQSSMQLCPTATDNQQPQMEVVAMETAPRTDIKEATEVAEMPVLDKTTVVVLATSPGAELNGSDHAHNAGSGLIDRRELVHGIHRQHNMTTDVGTV